MSKEKKLNIGLFIDTFYPMIDGVVNVVDNYAKRLNKKANVTVFAPAPREKFDDSTLPYKVVRCKMLKLPGLDYDLPLPKFDKKFKQALKDSKLDIIHIHSPFSIGKMGVKYAEKNNIPVVATMHSQFKQDFKKAVKVDFLANILVSNVAKVFNKSDLLLTMNKACENLAREYGVKIKIEIVPNATDLKDNIEARKFGEELKATLKIKDEKVFINIGRVNKMKNLDFVIDVCKTLKNKNFKFKLFIIGSGSDEKYFKNRVAELDLEKEIIFTGRVSNPIEKGAYFSISDLHIFPSFYDTDGIVRIEAAAFKVPTIFVENSMAASACTNNVNGFIEKNSVEAFAERIISVLNDEKLYSSISEGAYRDLYVSWDSAVEKAYEKYIILTRENKK